MSTRPLVLFDLDGTLIDSFGDVARSVNLALEDMGYGTRTRDQVEDAIGYGVRHLLASLLPEGSGGALVDRAVARFRTIYLDNLLEETRPFDGISDALARMSAAGAVLSVVTNKPEEPARRILEGLDLAPLMASLVGGDSTGEVKPARAPLDLALRQAAASAGPVHPAVFVGDSAPDRDAARTLGVPFVAVSWGKTSLGAWTDLAPSDRLVDSAAEMTRTVLALCGLPG